ncbi:hypothetical protein [Halanaeroarchaeum sulfurireducens]|uniref:Glutamate--cysteine ligase n=1 Tax=Halanaeroarchaeum sulfurireducens TaxID=1604004 RepID=A0A0F7PEE0_9EURY|nr:hypothetical protein [Halanaeroarchaeum sulfurireducens]AKH97984.1 hypothetical protein HLASF_1505 [Halanaeroarchaeum sulfurireducens]ALG82378.1 hypothetical protein HLASA_1492 [Halanaeroarchaeum sulfurireducens]
MSGSDLTDRVTDVLAVDAETFQERVHDDASVIREEIEKGTFDNPQAIVGLEYEFYAVNDDGALARLPRRLLEYVGFEKELGLHNAEMTTTPDPLNRAGIAAQESSVESRLEAARRTMDAEGLHLVSDGMWTIPPEGETTREYLTDSVQQDGVRLATNMSASARYHAMANATDSVRGTLEAPNVSMVGDTVMPESLITSIQPHYQVPQAVDLPEYFQYAVRIAGPLLALGVNSPFFPPDLYDDVAPETILDEGWMEHRIAVFESVLNEPGTYDKVRFPEDISTVDDAIDGIVEDDTLVPMPVEEAGRFDDSFAHFRRKHGTYWRWVRPVFGGSSRSAANARIEFRPLPAQPTVRDSIAFLAMYAGLLERMRQTRHPLYYLDWREAKANFYDAMRGGLGADLQYITADDEKTTDREETYIDLFEEARAGLVSRGFTEDQAAEYLWPLRRRARHEITPASWKRARVRSNIDEGMEFAAAVEEMQRTYFEKQRETLLTGTFADWVKAPGKL